MPRPIFKFSLVALVLISTQSFAQQPAAVRAQVQSSVAPRAPGAPFVVPPAQQAWLDQVLAKWEADSATVKNFYCDFERNRYNIAGPKQNQISLFAKEIGKLGYQKPDKGSFQIVESLVWTPKSQPLPNPNQPNPQQQPLGEYAKPMDANGKELPGEHWVSSGKYIYEYRSYTKPKQLVVMPIPPNMQGKQIVNGPLPFLFGAEAEDLKRRFWLRPAVDMCKNGYIGIHAKPKTRQGAADFTDVWVALRNEAGKPLMPAGIRVLHPNQSWDQYVFDLKDAQVNGMLAGLMNQLFGEPHTPLGWKRVEQPVQQPQQAAQPQQQPNLR